MRKFVFLFVFIFSLFVIEIVITSGTTKTDKPKGIIEKYTPKTVKEKAVSDSSLAWKTARASFYDSRDTSQTKKDCNGIGASGREIKSGSIALGSSLTESFIKKGLVVFIEIKDCDIVTPYGKGIFRVDDAMAKRFNRKGKYYIDFFSGDVNSHQKRLGRFKIKFRIYKIEKTAADGTTTSCFLLGVGPL